MTLVLVVAEMAYGQKFTSLNSAESYFSRGASNSYSSAAGGIAVCLQEGSRCLHIVIRGKALLIARDYCLRIRDGQCLLDGSFQKAAACASTTVCRVYDPFQAVIGLVPESPPER